jgi:hypothetical protein
MVVRACRAEVVKPGRLPRLRAGQRRRAEAALGTRSGAIGRAAHERNGAHTRHDHNAAPAGRATFIQRSNERHVQNIGDGVTPS